MEILRFLMDIGSIVIDTYTRNQLCRLAQKLGGQCSFQIYWRNAKIILDQKVDRKMDASLGIQSELHPYTSELLCFLKIVHS